MDLERVPPVCLARLTMQSRYIQYRAEMATADAYQTPALSDIIISGAPLPPPTPVITPAINWTAPAAITYGTLLSATQLNATTTPSVAGTFAYTPAAGTELGAGNGQTLSVTFTPTDTALYTSATGSVLINVLKATPVITWATPAAITYGTALSAAQLNATRRMSPGTFTYSPASGVVLNGGRRTLSATFTPTNTANYNGATRP